MKIYLWKHENCFFRVTKEAKANSYPSRFHFTVQPSSQSIKNGSTLTLTCKARYEQYSVRYKWYQFSEVKIPPDESSLLNQNNNTLTIDIYQKDSKLLFQCRAESEGQILFSDVAKVTIACKWDSYFCLMLAIITCDIEVNF